MDGAISHSSSEAHRGVPALDVRGLSKSFNGVPALRELTMTVMAGEIRAVVGANGSGKSTFIKLLSGYLEPDPGGDVSVGGERLSFGSAHSSAALGCRFVHQDLGLVDGMSVADNLFLSNGFPSVWGTLRRRTLERQARRWLERVNVTVDPARAVGELTAVERTEVVLARALGGRGGELKILVLDEPTATLPDREVAQLLATVRGLARQGVAVVYVSHRLDEVFELADSVTVLRDGAAVETRPVGTLGREELVTLMVGAQEGATDRTAPRQRPERAGQPLLSVRGLSAGALCDISFELGMGEIVGVAGLAGSGSDTLLGAVYGRLARTAGVVEIEGREVMPFRPDLAVRAGIGYVPPDRKRLGGAMQASAAENLTIADLRPFWKRLHLHGRQESEDVREWFDLLRVEPRDGARERLGAFSGGNQQKIMLARWLRRRPTVLLLDEPTQGVDVGARAEIHGELMREAGEGLAIMVSSTDTDELCRICDRILIFRRGRMVAELPREAIDPQRVARECLDVAAEVTSA